MTCFYCHKDRPVAPFDHHDGISRTVTTVDACSECVAFVIADREDEAAMFNAMVVPAPELPDIVERRVRQPIRDLTGQRFGDLTVLHSVELQRGRKVRTYWVCRCGSCGRSLPFLPESLRHGTKRCKACATARANQAGPLRGVAATRVGHPRRRAA
jgi:hypothetical protein